MLLFYYYTTINIQHLFQDIILYTIISCNILYLFNKLLQAKFRYCESISIYQILFSS